LEALSGTKVRSFSQPYGSSRDLTPDLAEHLERTGHKAFFLSESVANPRGADPFHLDRVSTRAESDDTLFFELEFLPRLRAVRNRLSGKNGRVQAGRLCSSANGQRAVGVEYNLEDMERRQPRG
jgi:hypothetical protein